ncbi:MAG: HDOD domain-containing protein [Gemmatimonadota bacterium]
MRQILADADFPAISREALDALRTLKEGSASTQRLANLVMRDYSLTLKVLRTANSAYYKRAGQPVRSATHAMMLLGASTVRHLAAGLLVFEHWRKRSPGLKELMLMSMLSANHAREIAMRRRLPDPEEAHLCGLFRNLGEVLVAGYFPKEYARVLLQMEVHRKTAGVAAFDVLEFTFDDLGEAMARHWGMPESVQAGIRTDPAVAASEISVITAFAHELTQAAYRADPGDREEGIAAVASRYARKLTLTSEDVATMMRAALRETREIFSAARVVIDDLRLRRQFDSAVSQLGGTQSQVPTPPAGQSSQTSEQEALETVREELTAEVLQAAKPDSGLDLNRVFQTLVEALYRGGPFDRVVFCVMSRDGKQLKARFGLGTAVEQLLDSFRFELLPTAGPVAVAMLRRQSAFVPGERDFTTQELRFAQALGASSIGIIPIVLRERLAGCIYVDRHGTAPQPGKDAIEFSRSLCNAAVRAISVRLSEAVAAPAPAIPPTPTGITPQYSATTKQDAILRVLRGESPETVAGELGLPPEQLERWRSDFIESGMKGVR